MKKKYLSISIAAIAFSVMTACGGDQKGKTEESSEADHSEHMQKDQDNEGVVLEIPQGARVFFENLQSGDQVTSPLTLQFGVEGMEVEPAGELVQGTGHHHLLIDRGFHERGTVVPADSVNIHYGDGSTSATIDLSPGEHTLTMQFADGYHQSYGEQMSAEVIVQVVKPE